MNSTKLLKKLNIHDVLLGFVLLLSLILLWNSMNNSEAFKDNYKVDEDSDLNLNKNIFQYATNQDQFGFKEKMFKPYEAICSSNNSNKCK